MSNSIIVDFLDLDTAKFTFSTPKPNNYGGKFVPVKYDGKTLLVKYGKRTCSFGMSTNRQKVTPDKVGIYVNDEIITGYSMSVSLEKDFESDPYYEKARELDEFFIDQCVKNCWKWGLGGTKTKPVARDVVSGYDDKGDNGKWKRFLKYAYKKNDDGEKVYQDYPPRFDFGVPCSVEEVDVDGQKGFFAKFKASFFDESGQIIKDVDSDNVEMILPNWSQTSELTRWSTIALGTYGASLKPKLVQVRIFPGETLNTNDCLLGDDEDEDFNDIPNALGDDTPAPAPTQEKQEEEEEEVLDEEEEEEVLDEEEEEEVLDEEEEEEEEVKPVSTRRRVTRKK